MGEDLKSQRSVPFNTLKVINNGNAKLKNKRSVYDLVSVNQISYII